MSGVSPPFSTASKYSPATGGKKVDKKKDVGRLSNEAGLVAEAAFM